MNNLFIGVLNISITASFAACAVILIRIPLKKAPKIFSYAIWSVVLFRLLCLFSFESEISMMPVSTSVSHLCKDLEFVNVKVNAFLGYLASLMAYAGYSVINYIGL